MDFTDRLISTLSIREMIKKTKTIKLSYVLIHLFDGALEFVHVAFKEREVGEKEILEAAVLLRVGGQHEDNPDGNLLLPSHTETWSAAFVRHVEALLD